MGTRFARIDGMATVISFIRDVRYVLADGIPPALAAPLILFLLIALRGLMTHWRGTAS